MTLTKAEQETLITFDATTRKWSIETTYPPHMNRIRRNPELYSKLKELKIDDYVVGIQAELSENATISPFAKQKRLYTEEEREILRERLINTRKNQNA